MHHKDLFQFCVVAVHTIMDRYVEHSALCEHGLRLESVDSEPNLPVFTICKTVYFN